MPLVAVDRMRVSYLALRCLKLALDFQKYLWYEVCLSSQEIQQNDSDSYISSSLPMKAIAYSLAAFQLSTPTESTPSSI